MIYVVLGMHKSGTTLVSQILHHSGIDMGEGIDSRVSYDQGNKYERSSCFALNADLLGLGAVEVLSLDVRVPDPLQITEQQRVRMRQIIRQCNEVHPDWGFKDPRTCLVYPLWASELPEHRLIVIVRPVGEVWSRYRLRRTVRFYRNVPRAWTVVKRWCQYNSNILTYLRPAKTDFLVLSYRELVTSDAEFGRLGEFVGRRLSDQRQTSLYRNRSATSPLIRVMCWLAQERLGCSPDRILEELDALRGGSGDDARRTIHPGQAYGS